MTGVQVVVVLGWGVAGTEKVGDGIVTDSKVSSLEVNEGCEENFNCTRDLY